MQKIKINIFFATKAKILEYFNNIYILIINKINIIEKKLLYNINKYINILCINTYACTCIF